MTVNKFKVIMDVETNLTQNELAGMLEKLPELVHHVYKADEGADVISLDVDINHLALTDQKRAG